MVAEGPDRRTLSPDPLPERGRLDAAVQARNQAPQDRGSHASSGRGRFGGSGKDGRTDRHRDRRAFDVGLDDEWRRTIRARVPIAVLAIDVDHFKSFNDHYGHLQGDQALRAVATCIGAVARRPGDLSARTGGEEFGMVLPDTELAGALGLAEQIRSSVEGLDLRHDGSAFGRLTVSIGVAVSLPKRGDICQDLLASADAALYTAKRAGRNRVLFARSRPVDLRQPAAQPDRHLSRRRPERSSRVPEQRPCGTETFSGHLIA